MAALASQQRALGLTVFGAWCPCFCFPRMLELAGSAVPRPAANLLLTYVESVIECPESILEVAVSKVGDPPD